MKWHRQGKLDPVIGRDEEIQENTCIFFPAEQRTILYWLVNPVLVKQPLPKVLPIVL